MTVPAVLFLIIGAATVVSARFMNVAKGKTFYQSSTSENDTAAKKALDGSTNYSHPGAESCFNTKTETGNWWYVDLGQVYDKIRKIKLYYRLNCCADNRKEITLFAGDDLSSLRYVKHFQEPFVCEEIIKLGVIQGRYVKIFQSASIAFYYLKNLLEVYEPRRNLRSKNDAPTLVISTKFQSVSYVERSFMYAAPKLWNSLPADIRGSSTLHSFKKALKTHLFIKVYGT